MSVKVSSTSKLLPALGEDPLLFVPPQDRTEYLPDDYKILCKSTPIPMTQIPYYLCVSVIRRWAFPVLWLGWCFSEPELHQFIIDKFPKVADRNSDGEMDIGSNYAFRSYLRRHFRIPKELIHRLDVAPVWDSEGKESWVLAVGSNGRGILPKEYFDKVVDVVMDGRQPAWYLDKYHWSWKSIRRVKALDTPRPKRSTITSPPGIHA